MVLDHYHHSSEDPPPRGERESDPIAMLMFCTSDFFFAIHSVLPICNHYGQFVFPDSVNSVDARAGEGTFASMITLLLIINQRVIKNK